MVTIEELVAQAKIDPNCGAYEEIIKRVEGIIYTRCGTYLQRNDTREEMWSYFYMRVWEAVINFDPSLGYKFSSFVYHKFHPREVFEEFLNIKEIIKTSRRNYGSIKVYQLAIIHGEKSELSEIEYDNVEYEIHDEESIFTERILLEKDIQEALEILPNRERYVILKNQIEGVNCYNIGQQLGISESRAYQLKQQGLTRMRKFLEERGYKNGI